MLRSAAIVHSTDVTCNARGFREQRQNTPREENGDNNRPLNLSPARMVKSVDQARLAAGPKVQGCLAFLVSDGQRPRT